jgi:hypothetical protein
MSKLAAFVEELKSVGVSREDAMREWQREREAEEKRAERDVEEKRAEREAEEKRAEREAEERRAEREAEERRAEREEKRQVRLLQLFERTTSSEERALVLQAFAANGTQPHTAF